MTDFDEDSIVLDSTAEILSLELDYFFDDEFDEMSIADSVEKIKTDGEFMNRLKDKMLEILSHYKDVEVVIDLNE